MDILNIAVEIQPSKIIEFRQAARDFLTAGNCPAGCEFRSMACDILNESLFCYMEMWDDAAAMAKHFESGDFRSLMGAMMVLGEIRESTIVRNGKVQAFEQVR